jgi:hypothetical protein
LRGAIIISRSPLPQLSNTNDSINDIITFGIIGQIPFAPEEEVFEPSHPIS